MDAEFKVGQRVFLENANESGEIIKIYREREYPILVRTDRGVNYSYTEDGFYYEKDYEPSLFIQKDKRPSCKVLKEALVLLDKWANSNDAPTLDFINDAYVEELRRIIR